MEVLIIEDEIYAQEKLERILLQVEPTAKVLAKIESVSKAVEWLAVNKPELVFMDIHLADGSAFSIFDQVRFDAPVIFTTAYDEYAIQAFKVNSIDYLMKPITKSDLQKAIDKYKTQAVNLANIRQLIEQFTPQIQKYKERFLLHEGEQILTMTVDNIAYFFADAKYVFLVDNSGVQHIVDMTIEKLSSELNPAKFFRVNRKFIVSIDAIKHMVSWSKGRVKLDLMFYPEPVVVSAERAKAFKEWLDD